MIPVPAPRPSLPSGCARAPEAGAYVLGALDPAERTAYARHLPRCPHCLREVGQLAGLPGLLGRRSGGDAVGGDAVGGDAVDRDAVDRDAGRDRRPVAPVALRPDARARDDVTELFRPDIRDDRAPDRPDTDPDRDPVSAALSELRRLRGRRRTMLSWAMALVVLIGVAGTAAAVDGLSDGDGVVRAPSRLPISLGPRGGPVTVDLALNPRAWGTEVVMRCHYATTPEYGADQPPRVYALVATGSDGSRAQLARWTALPDQDVVLATATDLPADKLSGLEVQDGRGAVVLRTDHL